VPGCIGCEVRNRVAVRMLMREITASLLRCKVSFCVGDWGKQWEQTGDGMQMRG
jgi:hypothetical protein